MTRSFGDFKINLGFTVLYNVTIRCSGVLFESMPIDAIARIMRELSGRSSQSKFVKRCSARKKAQPQREEDCYFASRSTDSRATGVFSPRRGDYFQRREEGRYAIDCSELKTNLNRSSKQE